MPVWAICLMRTCLSVLLGGLIGMERKMRSKEAGMRIHSIVCAGACIFMLVSKYGFYDSTSYDVSRVASQIVTGIGFLGAGVIMYRKNTLHNLTTAAGIWATAGIGMASGAGMYIFACGATLIVIFVQFLMHSKLKIFRIKQSVKVKIVFRYSQDCADKIKKSLMPESFKNIVSRRDDNGVLFTAVLTLYKDLTTDDIFEIMKKNGDIISIDCIDEDV